MSVFKTVYDGMIDRDELRLRERLTLALRSAVKATCAVEE